MTRCGPGDRYVFSCLASEDTELCRLTVKGYLPRKNVGEGVTQRIREILTKHGLVDAESSEVT